MITLIKLESMSGLIARLAKMIHQIAMTIVA
jgi:hypothetical protein